MDFNPSLYLRFDMSPEKIAKLPKKLRMEIIAKLPDEVLLKAISQMSAFIYQNQGGFIRTKAGCIKVSIGLSKDFVKDFIIASIMLRIIPNVITSIKEGVKK